MHRFSEILFRADQRVTTHHLLCTIPERLRGPLGSLQVVTMDQYVNVTSYKRAAAMQRKDVGIDGDAPNHFEMHARVSKRVHDSFKIVYQHVHTRFKD